MLKKIFRFGLMVMAVAEPVNSVLLCSTLARNWPRNSSESERGLK